jgi:hypothetical protein
MFVSAWPNTKDSLAGHLAQQPRSIFAGYISTLRRYAVHAKLKTRAVCRKELM